MVHPSRRLRRLSAVSAPRAATADRRLLPSLIETDRDVGTGRVRTDVERRALVSGSEHHRHARRDVDQLDEPAVLHRSDVLIALSDSLDAEERRDRTLPAEIRHLLLEAEPAPGV